MHMTLCTIGFAGKTAEEFFRLLTEAGVRKVIDVRENRGGQLSGYAKYPDLAFFLDRGWHNFLKAVVRQMTGANRGQRLNRALDLRLQAMPSFFVRLGLTRPHPPRFGRCQVMVDTLFPLPRKSWVEEILAAVESQ